MNTIKIASSVDTMFPANKKMNDIGKSHILPKDYFQKWLDSKIEQSSIGYECVSHEELAGYYELTPAISVNVDTQYGSIGLSTMMDPSWRGINVSVDYSKANSYMLHNDVSEGKSIAGVTYTAGLSLIACGIKETSPVEYKGIVPYDIVQIAESNKDKFDEILVLEPYEKEVFTGERIKKLALSTELVKVAERKTMLDDPILVGKIKEQPGFYFVLGYRYDELSILSFSKTIIQTQNIEDVPGVQLSNSKLLL